MALQLYEHQGGAPPTGLASPINSSAVSFTVNSGSGYPTGSGGALFVVCIDAGTVTEEKILCSARSTNVFTVNSGGRGYDGTTAASHSTGSMNVTHVWSAAEASDTSGHIYTTSRDDHTQYARTDGTRNVTGTQHYVNTVNSGTATFGGTVTASADATVATNFSVGQASTLIGAVTSLSTVQGTALIPSGLAGCTASGRFIGFTIAGAPVAGTFVAGDIAFDLNGVVWICTVSGSPGTWKTGMPLGTLAQASTTSNSSSTTTNVDWFTAPAFTVDGTRRIKASYCGFLDASVGTTDAVTLQLREGSSTLQTAQAIPPATGGTGQFSASSFWQGVPSAGSHTYKLTIATNAGTVLGAASATNPAFLLIEDVGL